MDGGCKFAIQEGWMDGWISVSLRLDAWICVSFEKVFVVSQMYEWNGWINVSLR